MSDNMEQTRLALPGNRGVFTHPSMRPRTMNNLRNSRFKLTSHHEDSQVNMASQVHSSKHANEIKDLLPDQSKIDLQSQGGTTEITVLNSARHSPRIKKETECGCSKEKFFESKNIFTSPV